MNIDMKKVYLIAVVLLLISVLGNVYGLYLNWNMLNTGGKISGVAGIGFTCIIVVIFWQMYKSTPSLQNKEWIDGATKQLEEALKK